jgi:hypothetical protein
MLFPVVIVHIALTIIGFAQQSGITGIVYRLSGNHMPAPNRHPRPSLDTGANPASGTSPSAGSHPPAGVKATVCIFQLTSDSQVVRQGPGSPYYRTVLTPLIRQVETDDKGYFQVFLRPGTYSVFTKIGDLFYASRRDEKNHIAPVEVLPGKMTRVECSVESDHKVVY